MKKIAVLDRQNIYDIALQEYGSVEGVFFLIEDNPELISTVNAIIRAGDVLKIRDAVTDKVVNKHYVKDGQRVSTVSDEEINTYPTGFIKIHGGYLKQKNGYFKV